MPRENYSGLSALSNRSLERLEDEKSHSFLPHDSKPCEYRAEVANSDSQQTQMRGWKPSPTSCIRGCETHLLIYIEGPGTFFDMDVLPSRSQDRLLCRWSGVPTADHAPAFEFQVSATSWHCLHHQSRCVTPTLNAKTRSESSKSGGRLSALLSGLLCWFLFWGVFCV